MNDELDPRTEDAVRRALGARAEEVNVSPDALQNIRDRRPSRGMAGRSLALAGVAAVVALLVGIAVVTQGDDGDDGLDVAGTTSTVPPATTEPTPTTSASPDTTEPFDEADRPDPVARVRAGYAIWPSDDAGAPSAEAAADGWAEEVLGVAPGTLGTPDISAETDVAEFVLPYVGEDGQPRGEDGRVDGIIITVASPDEGEHWLVERVSSENAQVDLVERNGFGDGLRISGWGDAFEGTGLLWIDDVGPVIVGLGANGAGDEFSVVVPWSGDEPVRVRLETGTVFAGEVPAVAAFATDPTPASTNISVVGVELDDVLNIRSGAGTNNEIVGSLDPFASALTHTGAVEVVGDDVWWEIVTTPDERIQGWVNARFLTVQREVVPGGAVAEAMIVEAQRFLLSQSPQPGALVIRPEVHPFGVDIGGIGIFADAPTPFKNVSELWSESLKFDWNPLPVEDPGGCADICVVSVRDFLDVRQRDVDDAEYSIGVDLDIEDPNFSYYTGLTPEFYGRQATVDAYVPPTSDGVNDWRRFTFAFDFIDGSPTIRAVWLWGWTP